MKKLKLADTELIAAHNCLNCGASNDAASGVVDKHARNTLKPKPGDVTLCLYCGHVSSLVNSRNDRFLSNIMA